MPAIVDPANYEFWLDTSIDYTPALKELLKPTTAPLEARAVANPKHPRDDDAALITPVALNNE
jgi:putative SOS response-associated peptidase YedK